MAYLFPYAGSEEIREKEALRASKIPLCSGVLRNILIEVCLAHKVQPDDVVGPGRTAKLVRARQDYIYRCRHETRASFPRIGRSLNRDHSTIVYHYHVVNETKKLGKICGKKNPKYGHEKFDPEQTTLTPRQLAIRGLLMRGYRMYEIASELEISTATVKTALQMIRKLAPLPKDILCKEP